MALKAGRAFTLGERLRLSGAQAIPDADRCQYDIRAFFIAGSCLIIGLTALTGQLQ